MHRRKKYTTRGNKPTQTNEQLECLWLKESVTNNMDESKPDNTADGADSERFQSSLSFE